MTVEPSWTEALLKRERLIILAGLGVLTGLAWLYVISGSGTGMSAASMTSWRLPATMLAAAMPAEWSFGYALLMLAMWWVMMIAMMLPSAAPVVLLHAGVTRLDERRRGRSGSAGASTAAFVAGYLAVWLAFSALATSLEWGLERIGAVDGMMMASYSRWLSGGLLLAAGLYQLSPVKGTCLAHCRAPVLYLSTHWRPGRAGAFQMGIGHGTYCLGCCWTLMLLLFAGGVMNLLWIAGLSAIVLVEKTAPFGARVAPWLGLVLAAAGVAVLAL